MLYPVLPRRLCFVASAVAMSIPQVAIRQVAMVLVHRLQTAIAVLTDAPFSGPKSAVCLLTIGF